MKSTTCKKCGNQIIWFRGHGGWVAVDAERVEPGDRAEEYEEERHGKHWTSCKPKPQRGYVKPEQFPVCTTPESGYIRQLSEEEEARIHHAINRG